MMSFIKILHNSVIYLSLSVYFFSQNIMKLKFLSRIEQLEEITCDWSPVSLPGLNSAADSSSQSEASIVRSWPMRGWGADHISIRFYSRLNVLFLSQPPGRQPTIPPIPQHNKEHEDSQAHSAPAIRHTNIPGILYKDHLSVYCNCNIISKHFLQ